MFRIKAFIFSEVLRTCLHRNEEKSKTSGNLKMMKDSVENVNHQACAFHNQDQILSRYKESTMQYLPVYSLFICQHFSASY